MIPLCCRARANSFISATGLLMCFVCIGVYVCVCVIYMDYMRLYIYKKISPAELSLWLSHETEGERQRRSKEIGDFSCNLL